MTATPVIAAAEAPTIPLEAPAGSGYAADLAPLGAALGLTKLGCSVITVPAGHRAFPFHAHHANDELFVVLEGEGELRLGEARRPLRAGDVVGCPAGGAETAHQIRNSGAGVLRYVAVSTMLDPEVAEYPDSGKIGVLSLGEGRDFFTARLRHVCRPEDGRDYWEGEA